ncbi:MAG: alpha/beta hydrolase fold protein [Nocardioidaceae bacterium]|nr:alpha/beta hydrolase fold protein [Nocardioidaceae bacterium]
MSPRTPFRQRKTPGEPTPVVVSEELFAPISADIELCYQTFGDPDDEPLLLVMGLGGPMIWWNPELCEQLAQAGFFVIRYDNRDTGRSSRAKGRVTRQLLVRAFLGRPVRAPYTVADLADDGFALLDHLGIGSAHLTGVSMGGMVVQTMAIAHPERVRSLVSIMSTTGRRTVGWTDPTLMPRLLAPRPPDRASYVTQSRVTWEAIGSPDYPEEPERTAERAGDTYDRGVSGAGVLRQMLAVLTQPNRTRALHGVTVPTLVLHGDSDRMVHVSGGRATAAAVPGAELVLVSGMGHDLPRALFGTFVGAIRRTADRAPGTAAH